MNIIVNRYNSQKNITMLAIYGCKMPIAKRWQVSLMDKRGRTYDFYFVAKPTKRQLRKLK